VSLLLAPPSVDHGGGSGVGVGGCGDAMAASSEAGMAAAAEAAVLSAALQRGLLLGLPGAADPARPCPLTAGDTAAGAAAGGGQVSAGVPPGATALWLAASRGNAAAVAAILAHPPLVPAPVPGAPATAPAGPAVASAVLPPVPLYVDMACTEPGCESPCTPLYAAVSLGSAEVVRLLLRGAPQGELQGTVERASLRLPGQTRGQRWATLPLCCAAALGHASCLAELLRSGGSASGGSASGGSGGCEEARHARVAIVNLASPVAPYRPPLSEAVWHVRPDCVRLLLGDPAIDATVAEEDGGAALHEACYWGRSRRAAALHPLATECLALVLDHFAARGLGLDQQDGYGCTALCHACAAEGDQAAWVGALLAGGAALRVRPLDSKTRGREAGRRSGAAARPVVGGRLPRPAGGKGLRAAAALGATAWGGSPLEEACSRGHLRVAALLCAAASGTWALPRLRDDWQGAAAAFAPQAAKLVAAFGQLQPSQQQLNEQRLSQPPVVCRGACPGATDPASPPPEPASLCPELISRAVLLSAGGLAFVKAFAHTPPRHPQTAP
jgi:ankyrin repeat protein